MASGTTIDHSPLTTLSSQAAAAVECSYARAAWRLMGLLLAFRMVCLAVSPLELVADEAYYWDWSRQLDYGYYSKPPMIAWLIAACTAVFGDSEFMIRLPAVLFGTAGLWAVFALGRALYTPRVGWWAMAAVAAVPGSAAMCLLMTIDAPFLCAWTFAVWFVWELFRDERAKSPWLWPAVIATGLGLLCKQTMFGILPLTFAWLATRRGADRRFSLRRFVLWAGGSLLFLLPVVWWNYQHGWITVQHTREHFRPQTITWDRHVVWYFEFVASQVGLLGPLTYALIVALGVAAILAWRRLEEREQFLMTFGMLPLVAITGLSVMQRVQPNWPAAFHLAMIVLLAAWGTGTWRCPYIADRWRRSFFWSIGVGAFCALLAYAVPFVVPRTELAGGRFDLTSRLRGWKQLVAEIDALRQACPEPRPTLVISATGRNAVSEIAYYLPDQPRVYQWSLSGKLMSQHDVWNGPHVAAGQDALLITYGGFGVPDELQAVADGVERRGSAFHIRGRHRRDEYDVWVLRGLKTWPVNRRRERWQPSTGPGNEDLAGSYNALDGQR